MSKKIVILYSGGLDSFIMMKLAKSMGHEVKLVHYDIGQAYAAKEIQAIRDSGEDVDIRKVDWLEANTNLPGKDGNNSGNIFIPGRNMVLAGLAASTFLPDEVWMGGLKGEDHAAATDKNQEFIDRTNKLWQYVYSPFKTVPKLVFPLIDMNWGKFEAVEWVYRSGAATVEEILKTSSCLSGSEEKNCGHCVVCCRRKYIFLQLGFHEQYEVDPISSESNRKMIIEMLSTDWEDKTKTPHYDEWRCREIIPGLYLQFKTTDHKKLIELIQEGA